MTGDGRAAFAFRPVGVVHSPFGEPSDIPRDWNRRKGAFDAVAGGLEIFPEFAPGLAARNHRTDSIDYAVILKGEIDMDIDGQVVHFKQGDALVQGLCRGAQVDEQRGRGKHVAHNLI